MKPARPLGLAKKKCLCEILRVTLGLSRLFGIAPISWRHPPNRKFFREDGQCEFYVNKWWILYTLSILLGYNTMFITYNDWSSTDMRSLSQVLNAVNSWSYYIFATVLSVIAIFKATALCETLNDVSQFLRKGLLCSFTKSTIAKTSHLGFVIIIAQLAFQYVALLFMSWNDQFNTRLSVKDFIDKSVHNVPFMFYYLFSTICSIYVGLFMCFDTTLLQTLNFDELQVELQRTGDIPLKDFDEEISSGFNTMEIVRCRGRHLNVLKQSFIRTGTMEDMDALRRLYKAIRDSLAVANDAFNPQITIHLFIELTVLVLHLYKVILYMRIPNKTTDQFTNYCIDWLFVVVHTIGLLIFLLSCQGIRASVRLE